MKKGIFLVPILAFAAGPLAVTAEPLSYSYLQASYQSGDILDEDFVGYGLGGSLALTDSIFAMASYSQLESDKRYLGSRIEAEGYDIGIGFHLPITTNLHFVASASYASAEVKFAGLSEDGDGYSVASGLRARAGDAVELAAFVSYDDIEGDGDTSYSVSASYYFVPAASVGVFYAKADDTDGMGVTLRLDF